MSDRDRVEAVVSAWAGIAAIPNTQSSLCDVWLSGPNATSAPCAEALEDLVERLRDEFPDRDIPLRPADFEGAIRHVDDLVAFVLAQAGAAVIGSAARRETATLKTPGAGKAGAPRKAATRAKRPLSKRRKPAATGRRSKPRRPAARKRKAAKKPKRGR